MPRSFRRRARLVVSAALAFVALTTPGSPGQLPAENARGPRGCSTPVSERKTPAGCYTTAQKVFGALPEAPLFWHIHELRGAGATTVKPGPRSVVVQSLRRTWLYTIAEEGWQPETGEPIAVIGPLQVAPRVSYTARYMEAVFPPDLDTGLIGHRHPGSEAWYVLSGTQCLETPNGLIMASAGQAAMVPEGWPMTISAVGPRTRRALVLVLHRSDEPYSMPVDQHTHAGAPHAGWKPKGLCPQ
jgi:quercetin dioxygenase-like cupin family protein